MMEFAFLIPVISVSKRLTLSGIWLIDLRALDYVDSGSRIS